jgi:hypothetical protein
MTLSLLIHFSFISAVNFCMWSSKGRVVPVLDQVPCQEEMYFGKLSTIPCGPVTSLNLHQTYLVTFLAEPLFT